MGLFDSLASKALGSVLGGQQGAEGGADLSGLIGSVMSGKVDLAGTVGQVMNSVGGLPGLQEKFQQSGLGDQFASWVGSGENQPIAPEQLEQAVGGNDALAGLAKNLGVDIKSVTPLLASLLPVIIDKLTPKGEVDQASAQGDGLQQALGGLLSGGNLTSVIGSVMGNSGGLGGLVGGLLGGNKA
jgi:uncharacterized protein YidB (DUF937 family)